MTQQSLIIEKQNDGYIGRFSVMASPCEILVEYSESSRQAYPFSDIESMMWTVYREAKRIEQKFSRYVEGNIVFKINTSRGLTIKLDEETGRLIDFAYQCYELSDGLFDISSGVLRNVWMFDGSDNVPNQSMIDPILERIGLNKINWKPPYITLLEGMELDFGGIGKEYAVDRCLQVADSLIKLPILINFGGDLACNGPRENKKPWQVGIESVGGGNPAKVSLPGGALATSGDAKRYLVKNGIRYSHILNPLTGSSVLGAPRSVTIAAPTCIEAGLMSTMAMLQGNEAENFLNEQDVLHWIQA